MSHLACHLCGAEALDVVTGYERFRRVTSDCRPWPAGGRLASCATCGTAQAVVDAAWRSAAAAIYAGYSIYQQADGAEQAVFDRETGEATRRSTRLVQRLIAHADLPPKGRLLDIGCGNGAFLRAFSDAMPAWSLLGSEVNDRYRSVIEAIDGVERLHTGRLEEISGPFDVIVMVHVLEHVASPGRLLEDLRSKLAPAGALVIQVPDRTQNPFEILIADHATHFSAGTLRSLVERAGFETSVVATDWVAKEVSLVSRPGGSPAPEAGERASGLAGCIANLRWLQALIDRGREIADRGGTFGLFGSSIAATWLAAELEGQVAFFVDEDPARRGHRHLGRPIHGPSDVPVGAQVLLALPDAVAAYVGARLRGSYTHFSAHAPAG